MFLLKMKQSDAFREKDFDLICGLCYYEGEVLSMGAVTVITSGKGGVGKSTVTAGLGTALARRGRRVLLVDADAGLPSLDLFLSCREEQVYDLSDVVAGRTAVSRALYPCPFCRGLWLLPAPAREADIVSPSVMRQLIRAVSPYYDHILIDCPAGLGMGFRSAAAAAQRGLAVATPDAVSLRGCETTRRALEEEGISQQRLIVNRFSAAAFRTQKTFRDLDHVIDTAGIRLIGVVPEDPAIPLRESAGEPLPEKSPAALAFARMAARLEGETIPLAPLRTF